MVGAPTVLLDSAFGTPSAKGSGRVESKLQASRFEYKYHISELQARSIYGFVRSYLAPDQFTPEGFNDGYAVHSLYLDSPDLHTCAAVLQGDRNRFKLRVRFYDNDATKPVFFEIKRRQNSVILKQRALVARAYAEGLVLGATPAREHLVRDDLKNWKALFEFCELRDQIHARPAAYTSYYRAGYEPKAGNEVRVTLDRRIRAGVFRGRIEAVDVENWPLIEQPEVLLELKFTDRFPDWMGELTEIFDLTRGSMPKYVRCVSLLNHDTLQIPR